MKTITLIFSLFVVTSQIWSQDTGNTRTVSFQITLVTPLGTNGTYAGNTINKVSINILAGYASGLEGVEFGGLANINRDFVNGAQFAGISNITNGDAKGVQFAGIANLNGGNASIAQFSGIGNVNIGTTSGFQGAGILNYTMGFSTVVQAAGIRNYAEELKGVQIGSVLNLTTENLEGAQICGVANIAEYVEGTQIAGVLNVARNVNGLQLGVINIADTVKSGIPIGVISIVRDGFREFEIGFSEGLNAYAAFKIGVSKFYNIFTVGTQFLSDRFRWGVGYGIGTHLTDRDDFKINLEGISYQINEGSSWTNAYNGLQQIKLTFAGGKNKHARFFGGPTFNMMVSDYINSNGKTGSNFPLYYFFSNTYGNTRLKYWIGFTAGIKIQ